MRTSLLLIAVVVLSISARATSAAACTSTTVTVTGGLPSDGRLVFSVPAEELSAVDWSELTIPFSLNGPTGKNLSLRFTRTDPLSWRVDDVTEFDGDSVSFGNEVRKHTPVAMLKFKENGEQTLDQTVMFFLKGDETKGSTVTVRFSGFKTVAASSLTVSTIDTYKSECAHGWVLDTKNEVNGGKPGWIGDVPMGSGSPGSAQGM